MRMHGKAHYTPTLINAVVAVLFLVLTLLVVVVNYQPFSKTLTRQFRTNSIPTAMLDNGKVGSILKQQGLVYARDNPGDRYPADKNRSDEASLIEINPFKRKRHVGNYLYQANLPGKSNLPSTLLATPATNIDAPPLLSIAASEQSLYSAKRGIVVNTARTSRQWERPSTFSLFDGDKLVSAGSAGVRLAGSKFMRLASDRDESFDFELFFRSSYGLELVDGKAFFGADDHALSGLVIEWDNALKNDLALDIADIAGLTTPRHRPMLFQLNGGKQQMRLFREPVTQKQWQINTAARELDFYRSGDDENDTGWGWYQEFGNWFLRISENLTMQTAATYIDVENLTDTLIVMMFCGSADWQNWAIYRDRVSHPYWKWITWDLQTCFSDRWKTSPSQLSEQHWLEVVASRFAGETRLRHSYGDYRSRLFVGLMNHDPAYRDYFVDRMHGFLDKLESNSTLQDKINRYRGLEPFSENDGSNPDSASLDEINEFVSARIRFLRQQIKLFSSR